MKRKPTAATWTAVFCAACFLAGLSAPRRSEAFGLKDILKVGGIALIVTQFDDQINSFINTFLGQRGVEHLAASKVVPVLRVGGGTAVGAVQVVGPQSQVDKVQAVAEIELNAGRIRGRALLPISTKRIATKTVRAIGGVGVSANIKHKL